MKRFVLLFFALAGFISSAAGQEQEITGFVYVSETPTPVPFASVWLCDPATGEPEYGTITAMNGWYDFGNVATDQTYQLKISGPGIRTRSKEIEIKYVPGRIGNIDYYIPVERSADTVAFRPVETYRPKQIAPDARTRYFEPVGPVGCNGVELVITVDRCKRPVFGLSGRRIV